MTVSIGDVLAIISLCVVCLSAGYKLGKDTSKK